ncbi:hypothetical protein GCM10010520_23050 [Rhizobium viscosum]
MERKISLFIDLLNAAKTIAEKDARRQMLVYLLDLAIVDAEEERERQRLSHADTEKGPR